MRQNLERLRHRGPDASTVCVGPGYVLGHGRLEIIGGAETGRQPIRVPGASFAFNGEIHNYRELAGELRAAGREVAPDSDTAVAFAALRHWGPEAVRRFRGFWAFVYVDEVDGEVWCSRDRYGQKPLCYARHGDTWVVASEAHALGVPLDPDPHAVRAYVAQAQYPTAPASLYHGVRQVSPGTIVTLGIRDGARREWRDYAVGAHVAPVEPYPVAVRGFAERLTTSLSLRLRSDVPIALLLSAGQDSGTLAALLADREDIPAVTYANGVGEDEAPEVLTWYGGTREIVVARRPDALRARVEAIHETLDAPMLSASALALDSLYAAARHRGCPVVLSGQGADEVLGGYHYYSALQRGCAWRARARVASLGGWRRLPQALLDRWTADAVTERLSRAPADPSPGVHPADAVTARRLADVSGRQLQSMLWYEDRISMLHSVETRCPFLDVELVEYCLGQPGDYFVHANERKRLLADAFGAAWPPPLRRARAKRGLPAGEAAIMLAHRSYFDERLRSGCAYLDLPPIQLGAYPRLGKSPRTARLLWRIAMLGDWLARH